MKLTVSKLKKLIKEEIANLQEDKKWMQGAEEGIEKKGHEGIFKKWCKDINEKDQKECYGYIRHTIPYKWMQDTRIIEDINYRAKYKNKKKSKKKKGPTFMTTNRRIEPRNMESKMLRKPIKHTRQRQRKSKD